MKNLRIRQKLGVLLLLWGRGGLHFYSFLTQSWALTPLGFSPSSLPVQLYHSCHILLLSLMPSELVNQSHGASLSNSDTGGGRAWGEGVWPPPCGNGTPPWTDCLRIVPLVFLWVSVELLHCMFPIAMCADHPFTHQSTDF